MSDNKAKTDDSNKPPLAMLPWAGLREVAYVQAYGHKKYKDFFNYRKGMEVSRNISCAMRHLSEYMDGQDLDAESGRLHVAHAACRLLFLLQNLKDGTAIDDRYKNEPPTTIIPQKLGTEPDVQEVARRNAYEAAIRAASAD
jgi:hypothetical protein